MFGNNAQGIELSMRHAKPTTHHIYTKYVRHI